MSETYNKGDFFKNANVGTRVYNSETNTYYKKTKKGWQKDDGFFSSLGTRYSELAMKGSIQYHSHKEYYNNTIGKDGSFNLHKDIKGFTITDDHPLAEKFRTVEQSDINKRRELSIQKQGDLYEKWSKAFAPVIDKKIKDFNKLYPNNPLTREIVNQYYAATDKAEFVKNHPVLQHYSHVHLPYDQKGRLKLGLNKSIFSSIISDVNNVEKFNKKKIELQNKYNIVPENKDNNEIPLFKSRKLDLSEIKDKNNLNIAKDLENQTNILLKEKFTQPRKTIVLGTKLE